MVEPAEIPYIIYTIGQICVALIGFTGLVSVFGHREGQRWSREEILRLHTLIEPAACGLFGSLTPPTILMLTMNPDTLWRLSCGVLSILILAAFAAYLLRARAARQAVSQKVLSAVSGIVLVSLLLAAFGVLPRPDFVLVLGLWLTIIVASHNFALLLFDLARRSVADAD